MPLYNRLKEYRARINVNQSEMGKLVGVSRQTISQIERGDYSPSVTLALKIAKVCGARVEDIFEYEDVTGTFMRTADGYRLSLKPAEEESFEMWCRQGGNEVWLCGNWSIRLYRFALWVGFGLMTLPGDTLAIHSSCIVCQDKAVLFLGESGTGKSTHTRLWREHVPGAVLLNDDSPMIRIEDGKVWAYGSAWSGKTPCYKNERYELAACVRLSQAPANAIRKLSVLQAYGALHPSCAPEFATMPCMMR